MNQHLLTSEPSRREGVADTDRHSHSSTFYPQRDEQQLLAAEALLAFSSQDTLDGKGHGFGNFKRKHKIQAMQAPPIDQVLSYPMLMQQGMNCGDASEFYNLIGKKCEDTITVLAHYVDQHGKVVHTNMSRCYSGIGPYLKQVEDMFQTMPDMAFRVANTNVIHNKREISISCEFSLRATYLEYYLKTPDLVANSEPMQGEPLSGNNSQCELATVSFDSLDTAMELEKQDWQPIPDREGAGILGQFLPSATYQLQLPPGSPLDTAQAMDVNLNGRLTFHVDPLTQMIRRIDAIYLE
jgi:hypothetical protein